MICTTDAALGEWAREQQVPVTGDLAELQLLATSKPYDYLFSIVNFRILPASLLRTPRRLAVNYHDGPLPRYGGTHVTSWAILQGEQAHAITWHVMAERVDQGDILKQVPMAIAERHTAATLNAKCHFAAVRAFRALLGELADDSFTRTPQALEQRTFFPRSKKPTPDCVVPMEWPADQIDRFVRALDFGPVPSPIGVAKVVLGGVTYAVASAEKCADASGVAPGTVLESGDGRARVATGSVDVILSGLERLTPP